MTEVVGVILAGGLATRMGGGDKGLLDLGGRSLLAHVIERLAPQVSQIAINANGPAERFAAFGVPIAPDPVPGNPGPLAGILAGMEWAATTGASHVVSVAADTPFFPRNLVVKLQADLSEGDKIATAATQGETRVWWHPTFALWPVDLAEPLRAAIEAGTRRVVVWAGEHGNSAALFETGAVDPFFNVNTPQDLADAERMLARAAV